MLKMQNWVTKKQKKKPSKQTNKKQKTNKNKTKNKTKQKKKTLFFPQYFGSVGKEQTTCTTRIHHIIGVANSVFFWVGNFYSWLLHCFLLVSQKLWQKHAFFNFQLLAMRCVYNLIPKYTHFGIWPLSLMF